MKDKLQKAIKAAMGKQEALMSAAESNEDGLLTAEQTSSFTERTADIENYKSQLAAIEAHEANQLTLVDPTPVIPVGQPVAPVVPQASGITGERSIDPRGGYFSIGHFAQDLFTAAGVQKRGGELPEKLVKWQADAEYLRLEAAPTNPHKETGQDTGFMVPTEFRDDTFESVKALPNSLVNLIDTTETSRNSITMPADETTPWGASGIQARWGIEGGQKTESRLVTEGRTIKLDKLYVLTTASDEVLEDAPLLTDRLSRKAPLAIDWMLSDAIANGTGAGMPLGYRNSGAKVQVTRNTALLVDADDVSTMYSRQVNQLDAVWICSRSCFPQLQTMTISNQPVYLPPNGMAGAPNGTLMGRPLLFNQSCPSLGTPDDIQFVDLKWYLGVRKAGNTGTKFDTSMHLYFDFDVTAFRWVVRFGGANLLESAIAQPNSDPALSNIVTLGSA